MLKMKYAPPKPISVYPVLHCYATYISFIEFLMDFYILDNILDTKLITKNITLKLSKLGHSYV